MEKIAHEIEEMLQEKLSCYRQLYLVFEGEKKSIASIDIEALWASAREKKKLAGEIEMLREKILGLLKISALDMDMDVRSFSLAYLVNTLPFSARAKSGLRKAKLDINTAKDQVGQIAKENRVQVRKYLTVVDDIMSIFGDNSAEEQYTGAGVIPGYKKPRSLFRAEV